LTSKTIATEQLNKKGKYLDSVPVASGIEIMEP
jgi:hypothetical protein